MPGGSRIAIVFNGSPLFTGDAGSGESSIRRWIIEQDWLEAIIALPDQLFYNTGISTYIWVLTNRKEPHRVGKVQLIDGREFCVKMEPSMGNKRNRLSDDQIADLTRIHGSFTDGETTGGVTFTNRDEFTARLRAAAEAHDVRLPASERNAVLAALSERDPGADICEDRHGNPEPDTGLRDTENVPLGGDIDDYMEREVLPHIPDAWIDRDKTKIGYQIPLNRHFYVYEPPRPLEAIEADLRTLETEIAQRLAEVTA